MTSDETRQAINMLEYTIDHFSKSISLLWFNFLWIHYPIDTNRVWCDFLIAHIMRKIPRKREIKHNTNMIRTTFIIIKRPNEAQIINTIRRTRTNIIPITTRQQTHTYIISQWFESIKIFCYFINTWYSFQYFTFQLKDCIMKIHLILLYRSFLLSVEHNVRMLAN